MSWLDKLKDYAPAIATTLATGGVGALPAVLVGILGKELLGNEKADTDKVEDQLQHYTRLATRDPEIAAQLKKADISFQQSKLELLYQDRADARQRDISIQTATGSNRRADWMLVMAFIGFLVCLGAFLWMFFGAKQQPDAGTVAVICTFGTTFLNMLKEAFSFEFGGSAEGTTANQQLQGILKNQMDVSGR